MSAHAGPVGVAAPQPAPPVRAPNEREGAPGAPSFLRTALQEPGEPLDGPTRRTMQIRFGHDFSRVRIHAGAAAARSAAAIEASAWTLGRHVVFGRGCFEPHTRAGSRRLAHELAHVVQQRDVVVYERTPLTLGEPGHVTEANADDLARRADVVPLSDAAPVIRRRNLFQEIGGLFAGDDFPVQELENYLQVLDKTGAIEGYTDSDNKARAITWAHVRQRHDYNLTTDRKVLLIEEMQDGSTGDDDENAILALLGDTGNDDLATMFGAGKLDPKKLDSDIDGEENDRLHVFFDRHFVGGTKAVLDGKVMLKPIEFFGKELVEVGDAAEEKKVRAIIQDIHDRFGIDLDSQAGVEAIKHRYADVSSVETLDGLKTRVWSVQELEALQRALEHYAPILGKRRADSTRAGDDQEVSTVAKDAQSITTGEDRVGRRDFSTEGEYYAKDKLFGLYKAAEKGSGDLGGDVDKEIEGIVTHEIAHGVLAYRLPDFLARFPYWIPGKGDADPVADTNGDENGVAVHDVEAPPSKYGTTSYREDLSETAMFFFVAPQRLKDGMGEKRGTPGNPCPERHQFLEETVKAWAPPPKPAPRGVPAKVPSS